MSSSMSSCEPKMEKKKAIVGAGISGLLACKHTMEKGFNPVVFEARNGIGGVWSSTIDSTKLQTPKNYYQFSDLSWPLSVKETFPDQSQVMDYIKSYALRFGIFTQIEFNSKVVSIKNLSTNEDEVCSWELWSGTGKAFSPKGKWNVVVQDVLHPLEAPKVYQVDFVILCIGKFSDLPKIPHFEQRKGPEVFRGKVIHSMDYAAMNKIEAVEFIKDKRVTVVGFQKSALDIAAQVSKTNGVRHPCTLLFRRVQWSGSENLVRLTFRNLNRFSELMIHKPQEGLVLWLLAFLLSPLRWIFTKLIECYLRWIYPLKKYNMIPDHTFLKQIYSCMFTVLPDCFYERVEDGSLILKRSRKFCFCTTGLIIDDEVDPLETDIVIFATGYKSDEKISNIFALNYFKKCITGSSTPFYRYPVKDMDHHIVLILQTSFPLE
ncbi:probable flavin-containing monooxygenase 1 [Olea europaea subsp. europaea]|uniref:Flavin-containing monooxygenase n=1 Tax=Olea europaea subsp. europaea TaxID=158383 RepID=A0A8S0TQZ0_OLEEU|nr:probable flavin-containing monooxygenase 1 [Olea europaea subsp. europaea]